jgi:hypothetical protein
MPVICFEDIAVDELSKILFGRSLLPTNRSQVSMALSKVKNVQRATSLANANIEVFVRSSKSVEEVVKVQCFWEINSDSAASIEGEMVDSSLRYSC